MAKYIAIDAKTLAPIVATVFPDLPSAQAALSNKLAQASDVSQTFYVAQIVALVTPQTAAPIVTLNP